MRYLAKTDDGRTVGEGRTIKTAVDRARKRDGAYVVDDSTGVIQWRNREAVKLCECPRRRDLMHQPGCTKWGDLRPEAVKLSPSWYATTSAGGHQGMIADENDPTGRTFALTYDPKDAEPLARIMNAHAALVAFVTKCNHGVYGTEDDMLKDSCAALRAAGEA